MANQVPLQGSAMVVGIAQSGKTTWSIENMEANPDWCIFVDRNRAVLRLRPPLPNYLTGPWQTARRQFLYLLAKFRKVIYNPPTDDDIFAMLETLFAIKNKAMRNFEKVFIYFDEIDLYCDRQCNAELCWTKYQGAGICPVGIVQRVSQMRNLNIFFNSNAGVVVFNVTDGDAQCLVQNYGVRLTVGQTHPNNCGVECDLCYIQQNSRVTGANHVGACWIPTAGQAMRL